MAGRCCECACRGHVLSPTVLLDLCCHAMSATGLPGHQVEMISALMSPIGIANLPTKNLGLIKSEISVVM